MKSSSSLSIKILRGIARVLCSLRLAVLNIIGLAVALAAATILESMYDTQTAWYWVYDSTPFSILLCSLGINILAVALSRLPWKKRHLPFLLAHFGILLLLIGSWITRKSGVDGSIRIEEGRTESVVETSKPILFVMSDGETDVIPVPWIPPGVSFSPIKIKKWGLTVSDFLPHADSNFRFVPTAAGAPDSAPALQVKLEGGPMQISQEFWLWGGDPAWSSVQMGPARFNLFTKDPGDSLKQIPPEAGQARMDFIVTKEGGIRWVSISRRGEKKAGSWPKAKVEGSEADPGWMTLKLKAIQWIPYAMHDISYAPARIQYGERAPPSAIQLEVEGDSGNTQSIWMGIGDRIAFTAKGKKFAVQYGHSSVPLPFGLRLERFEMDFDPGTRSPSAYRSSVKIQPNGGPATDASWISMNEPLDFGGYTFYQASYEPREPRPIVSVFSVNRDPGRMLKYLGSILLVLGIIILFVPKFLMRAKELRK